jgi:hypothetical protein
MDYQQQKASSTDVATIVIVVVVAAMIIVLLGLVIWQIVKNGNSVNEIDVEVKDKNLAATARNNRLNNRKGMRARTNTNSTGPRTGRRYGVANPRATPHHEPLYDQPAPMPTQQLTAPENMPPIAGEKYGVQTSSYDQGEYNTNTATTEFQGAAASSYSDSNYLQDPGMMTPSTATDIKGLQTFMPYMGGGVGSSEKDGPVDPETGLPLFTTGKLVRSQLLGGIGSGSFLRQQQDPLSGYRKNVGRLLCGAQRGRKDIEMRRKQFNAARLEGGGDPVIFNTGEFAYL